MNRFLFGLNNFVLLPKVRTNKKNYPGLQIFMNVGFYRLKKKKENILNFVELSHHLYKVHYNTHFPRHDNVT